MTKNKKMKDILRDDASIVVNRKLAHEIGIDESIVYSQLASLHDYWKGRNDLTKDGFFFVYVDDLEKQTTFKKDKQNTIINKLISLGLIERKMKGIPPKRFFRITDEYKEIFKRLDIEEVS